MEVFLILMVISFMYLFNINMYMLILLNFIIMLLMFGKLSFLCWWDINLYMGLNFYNYGLIILSLLILNVIMMNLNNNNNNNNCVYLVLIMFLMMILNFLSMNLLMYYFMYEGSLIMIYYLIVKWSHSKFKLFSSYMLLFYTLMFSLPMLLMIIFLIINEGSLNFLILEINMVLLSDFMLIYFLMGFLVKIPMYLFHGWLLKAHVEAPYFGSMILAAVMLKLGSYGLLRMLMFICSDFFLKNYLILLNILGMVIMSLYCMQQIDMKLLIAVSSVVHMGLMISSMFIMNKFSYEGSYLMMLSHGFCSSGLFYLVNEIYKNTNTRLMIINKGIIIFMPIISMIWFMLCISNSAAPLSMNLFSEIFLMSSLFVFCNYFIILLLLYCFFSFMYNIYLFFMIHHGLYDIYMCYFYSGNLITFYSLMLHWFPINLSFMILMFF